MPGFLMRHRIIFALCGLVIAAGIIIPACSGGDGPTDNPTGASGRDFKVTKTGVVSGQTITSAIVVSNGGDAGSLGDVIVTDEVQTAPPGSAFTSSSGALECSGP